MSSGPVSESFEAFMSRALMDPKTGYYARKVAGIGARGDFATSASVGDRLARAIAAWLVSAMKQNPQVRTIIEVGGGEGSLMVGVRKHLGWWHRRRCRWIMVEQSAPLMAKQKEQLGRGVTWVSSMDEAMSLAEGCAFVYHNEFLDALPFIRVEWSPELATWQEVWLTRETAASSVKEVLRLVKDACWTDADYSVTRNWNSAHPPPAMHQRGEMHAGVRNWLHSWAPLWRDGAMLTLDYGDLFPALYHRRPRGTARAYLMHQRLDGMEIYQNPGRQDITSDINFTDIREWSAGLGWKETAYGSQGEFLNLWAPIGRSSADAYVADPDGAGEAFKFHLVRPC